MTSKTMERDGIDSRKLRATRRNERIKMLAASVYRLSTVVVAGGALGPVVQGQGLHWATADWFAGAIVLHLIAQGLLGLLEVE